MMLARLGLVLSLVASLALPGPALAGPALAGPAPAGPWSQLIVFGDSLSDTGNIGRFTAGYLWDEHLGGALGVPLKPSNQGGTDYAMAGALITSDNLPALSLPHQVAQYLHTHPQADKSALYVIWGGANDVLVTLGHASAGPGLQRHGIADTLAMVRSLYAAGARNFVVGNVPRVDFSPFVRSHGIPATLEQARLVQSWNAALGAALADLHPRGARIWLFDAGASIKGVFVSPTHFDFTNLTTPCGTSCADPDHTFFWDDLHPGATEHAALGDAVLSLISQ